MPLINPLIGVRADQLGAQAGQLTQQRAAALAAARDAMAGAVTRSVERQGAARQAVYEAQQRRAAQRAELMNRVLQQVMGDATAGQRLREAQGFETGQQRAYLAAQERMNTTRVDADRLEAAERERRADERQESRQGFEREMEQGRQDFERSMKGGETDYTKKGSAELAEFFATGQMGPIVKAMHADWQRTNPQAPPEQFAMDIAANRYPGRTEDERTQMAPLDVALLQRAAVALDNVERAVDPKQKLALATQYIKDLTAAAKDATDPSTWQSLQAAGRAMWYSVGEKDRPKLPPLPTTMPSGQQSPQRSALAELLTGNPGLLRPRFDPYGALQTYDEVERARRRSPTSMPVVIPGR